MRPGVLRDHKCVPLQQQTSANNIKTFNINEIDLKTYSKAYLKIQPLTAKEIALDTTSSYKCLICIFESTVFDDFNQHWRHAHLNKAGTSNNEDDTETNTNEDIIIEKEIIYSKEERTDESPQDPNQVHLIF